MGQDPSDEEIFDMIAAVDDDGSNEIGSLPLCDQSTASMATG